MVSPSSAAFLSMGVCGTGFNGFAVSVRDLGAGVCCSRVEQPENANPRQVTTAHLFRADRDTRATTFPANLQDSLLVAAPHVWTRMARLPLPSISYFERSLEWALVELLTSSLPSNTTIEAGGISYSVDLSPRTVVS